jgi:hypothetical protein
MKELVAIASSSRVFALSLPLRSVPLYYATRGSTPYDTSVLIKTKRFYSSDVRFGEFGRGVRTR